VLKFVGYLGAVDVRGGLLHLSQVGYLSPQVFAALLQKRNVQFARDCLLLIMCAISGIYIHVYIHVHVYVVVRLTTIIIILMTVVCGATVSSVIIIARMYVGTGVAGLELISNLHLLDHKIQPQTHLPLLLAYIRVGWIV